MEYTYQAKATKQFGVEFRSKLEAQYAYWFQTRGLEWSYADKEWYDFTVKDLAGTEIKVEVKPHCSGALLAAVKRIPADGQLVIFFGQPPEKKDEETGFWEHDGFTRTDVTESSFACLSAYKSLFHPEFPMYPEAVFINCAMRAACNEWFDGGFHEQLTSFTSIFYKAGEWSFRSGDLNWYINCSCLPLLDENTLLDEHHYLILEMEEKKRIAAGIEKLLRERT